MITLTESATHELRQRRLVGEASPEQAVRFARTERGILNMAVESPSEGDVVIRRGRVPLLIIGSQIAEAMDGGSLDYGTVGSGSAAKEGFTFRHRAVIRREGWGLS